MKKIILSDTFSIQMLNQNAGCHFEQITLDQVKSRISNGFVSAVSDEDTANVLSSLLEVEISKNSTTHLLAEDLTLILFQMTRGVIKPGMAAIPDNFSYQFWKVDFAKEWKIELYNSDEIREYYHSEVSSPQELYDRLKEEWDKGDDSYSFKVYHYGVLTFDSGYDTEDEDSFFELEISDIPTRKYIFGSLEDLKYEWRKKNDLREYKRIKKRYNLD